MQATGSERPRFRQEHLVAEPIEEQGAKFIDVMDPDTGNLFRFFEVEFSLACAMDGERDIAGIVKWAQEELGVTPTATEVRSVVATLGELGYLDQTADARAAAAAVPSRDEELAPGIVVGPGARSAGISTDVELGSAGTTRAPVREADLPKAPDLALGAPGGVSSTIATRMPVADVQLGAPGRNLQTAVTEPENQVSDVSLDLSEHIAVRADDVKEAVRASKVMQAVDVPKELMDALEAPSTPEKPALAKPVTAEAKPAEAKPVEKAKPVVAEVKPAEKAKPAVAEAKPTEKAKPAEKAKSTEKAKAAEAKPAVELPKKPVVEKPAEKTPVAPPAPGRGVSPLLVVFLILAIGGAAAYFGWKYLIKSKADDSTQSMVQPPPVAPVKQPDPPPPPAIKLALDEPAAIEIKAAVAGQIETVDSSKTVKRDTIVVKIAGYRPIANEIAALTKDIEKHIPGEVAQAEKDLAAVKAAPTSPASAANITKAEAKLEGHKKSLADKQTALAAKQAELDKYLVKAPADGELTLVAKPGKIAADAPLFSIKPEPVLEATFKSDGAPAANTLVYVNVKGTDKPLTCKVTQVDTNGAKVVCPADPTLSGKEVTLGGPAPAPAPADPIEMTPTPPTPPTPSPTPPPRRPVAPRPKPPVVEPKPVDPPADPATKPADPAPAGSATP